MTTPVQQLLDFHNTRNFGTRENLLARQREARVLYAELTPGEQAELAEAAISQAEAEHSQHEEILCCLACFQPGSLANFHSRLVERRILYPSVIFHGAGSEIASEVLPLLENDEYRYLALAALAWIGDETVQAAFASWREDPPPWASELTVPPERFAHEAGWELSEDGTRRDLFSQTAFPLVPPTGVESHDASVQTGIVSDSDCPWCGRHLTVLLEVEDIGKFMPGHDSDQVSVLTCDVCTGYGIVFANEMMWHKANVRPDYLPPDSSDWDAFPKDPLVLSGQTRHFLEAANWSMLPGVAFSQVGGLPTWIQDAEYPSCPDCSRTMPFVGQISNEDFMEYGEGIYYCFHCPDCRVTATNYQQT